MAVGRLGKFVCEVNGTWKGFWSSFFLKYIFKRINYCSFRSFSYLGRLFFFFFSSECWSVCVFAAWYLCKPAPVALGLKRFSFRVHTVTLKLGEIHQTPPFFIFSFLFFSFCSFFNYSQKCMGRKKNVKWWWMLPEIFFYINPIELQSIEGKSPVSL